MAARRATLRYASGYNGESGCDYLEIAAWSDGVRHIAHVAWADNRDIPPAKCPTTGPPPSYPDATGAANTNVYTSKIVIAP